MHHRHAATRTTANRRDRPVAAAAAAAALAASAVRRATATIANGAAIGGTASQQRPSTTAQAAARTIPSRGGGRCSRWRRCGWRRLSLWPILRTGRRSGTAALVLTLALALGARRPAHGRSHAHHAAVRTDRLCGWRCSGGRETGGVRDALR